MGDLAPTQNRLRLFVQDDTGEHELDLTTINLQEFFKNDIIRHRISGEIPTADFRPVNFVESILLNATGSGIAFSECDFKDTLIRNSSFTDCKFDGGTFATAFLSDCEFCNCTFYNTAAYNSDFYRTQFRSCNLDHLLIKSSRFFECTFDSCKATNKLLEMSTLDGVIFRDTEIQIQTITGNFGLTSADLVRSPIRSGRSREQYRILQPADLWSLLDGKSLSSIEKLRLEYFLRSDLKDGSDFLDQALNLSRWTAIYKNPGSFVELLDSFSEFIVYLYDRDKLCTQAVLLLHYVTSTLMTSMPTGEDLHRVAMSLGGTHMILSRIVERYLEALYSLSDNDGKSITFLAEGSDEKEYFYKELAPWFEEGNLEISRLVRHNSPVELLLTAHWGTILPMLAAFLACRTKLEISRLRDHEKGPARGRKAISASRSDDNVLDPLLAINSGMAADQPGTYELQVKALLPGSLLIDLKLQFGTKLAGRLRKMLIGILS